MVDGKTLRKKTVNGKKENTKQTIRQFIFYLFRSVYRLPSTFYPLLRIGYL